MSSESFELLLCSNFKQYEHEAHISNIFWNLSQYILIENSSKNYEKRIKCFYIFFSTHIFAHSRIKKHFVSQCVGDYFTGTSQKLFSKP